MHTQHTTWPRILLTSSFILLLVGCSRGIVTPPSGSPTVSQAYEEAWQGNMTHGAATEKNLRSKHQSLPRPLRDQPDVSDGLRTVSESMSQHFPTLPNPQLVLYVFPHFAGQDQAPVAGYYTAFSLYTRNYYALPSEEPSAMGVNGVNG